MFARIMVCNLLCFLMFFPYKALAVNCEDIPSEYSKQETCNYVSNFKKLNSELNEKYQDLLNNYRENDAITQSKMLIDAQQAWINLRDKTCVFESNGDTNSEAWLRCNIILTNARIQYFESRTYMVPRGLPICIGQTDSTPEGGGGARWTDPVSRAQCETKCQKMLELVKKYDVWGYCRFGYGKGSFIWEYRHQ